MEKEGAGWWARKHPKVAGGHRVRSDLNATNFGRLHRIVHALRPSLQRSRDELMRKTKRFFSSSNPSDEASVSHLLSYEMLSSLTGLYPLLIHGFMHQGVMRG